MGRRGQSKGRASGSSRGSSRGGRSSRGGSSPMPIIAGLVGVVIIGVVIFFVVGGKKDEEVQPEKDKRQVSRSTPSNLDTEAAKTNTTTKSNEATKSAPMNAYDKAKNASYDMATLRPLAEKVDRTKWGKIDQFISEAYVLKSEAEKAMQEGKEDEYKTLAAKAFNTWREGDRLFEDWQFEIQGIHRDLWDACFQKEEMRYAKSSKALRGYMQFQNYKH